MRNILAKRLQPLDMLVYTLSKDSRIKASICTRCLYGFNDYCMFCMTMRCFVVIGISPKYLSDLVI